MRSASCPRCHLLVQNLDFVSCVEYERDIPLIFPPFQPPAQRASAAATEPAPLPSLGPLTSVPRFERGHASYSLNFSSAFPRVKISQA